MSSPLSPNRYAVCIGINSYHPSMGLSSLSYAEDDAQAMDALLGQLGFAPENRCLLLGPVATLEAVNDALSKYILDQPEEEDLVLFYFAGHSLPLIINRREVQRGEDRRSEVFLATYDFDIGKAESSLSFRQDHALGMERLRQKFFEGDGSRKRLFIFDSCYSGYFYGQNYRDGTNPVQGYIKHALYTKNIGRVAFSSCLPWQESAEDPHLKSGRFTYYVLKALSGQAREALRYDGCLTVGSLFEYVAHKLPPDQRPVLSGVQQDVFELCCYPEAVSAISSPSRTNALSEETKQAEREQRLRALLADHGSFLRDRLRSFVGREKELKDLHMRIAEKQQTGGYITITGQAGQGKSSIIAKLVEMYGVNDVAFHFIPFNPGPDHQVGLLRNLMARLILKYDLSDLYVASDSRAALRDYFPKVLAELAAKGGQEVIFIDGLDQLESEQSGERDLSFLPNNPPVGVIFVLGTRPNDTLRPLELLKPRTEYQLPELSRADFDLILAHRQVSLEKSLAERFYHAMQGNALFLDLLAKELTEQGIIPSEALITQIADNPEHLFTLTMARLKRQPIEWREVIKPILGALLVAREPLGLRQLRQLLGVDDERVRDGIERLGGLIVRNWQHRYSLFHLKLFDYLRQDQHNRQKEYIFATDEEVHWHKRLVDWCSEGEIALMWKDVVHDLAEQERRGYARQHYIAHLYAAREWDTLFAVLDEGMYGQAKLHVNTRSYVQDLDMGRLAAAWEGWNLEEGVQRLPHLWRYTLLRCSLGGRANRYPITVLEFLVLLNRAQEAIDLAELMTDSLRKTKALLAIGRRVEKWQDQLQIFLRVQKVAETIENTTEQASVLGELCIAVAQVHQLDWAVTVSNKVVGWVDIPEIRNGLIIAYTRANQWERAKSVIAAIKDTGQKVNALEALGIVFASREQWEQAASILAEAEALIRTYREEDRKALALSNHGKILTKIGRGGLMYARKIWAEAEIIIQILDPNDQKVKVLTKHGAILASSGYLNRARLMWAEAESIIQKMRDSHARGKAFIEQGNILIEAEIWEQAGIVVRRAETEVLLRTRQWHWQASNQKMLFELCIALMWVKEWDRAENIIYMLNNIHKKIEAWQKLIQFLTKFQEWDRAETVILNLGSDIQIEMLSELGVNLVQAQEWGRAKAVWTKVEKVLRLEEQYIDPQVILLELATALAQAGQWDHAEKLSRTIEDSVEQRQALQELVRALVQAGQWERAEKVIRSIENGIERYRALQELVRALVQAGQWDQAEKVIYTINSSERYPALQELGIAWAQAGQWERAEKTIHTINSSERYPALQGLIDVLARAGQWERAEKVIHTIENSAERSQALLKLGTALARAGQWEQAEKVIHTIENSFKQNQALQELGIALARAGQWEQAEEVIRIIGDSTERYRALRELGIALARAGQWEQAERVISTIDDLYQQGKALQELGIAWAQAGQWERAERIINTVGDLYQQSKALQGLGTALAQAGQWEQAEKIIRIIEDSYTQGQALQELVQVLIQTGQWEQAERVISTIGDLYQQSKALQELVQVLIQTGQWEQAERVISTIGDLYQQSKALQELGIALAQAGQWEQAEKIIHSINGISKYQALQELGVALAQAGQWEQTQKLIGTLQNSSEQIRAWREVAIRIFKTNGNEQLLHFIHYLWGRTKTRGEVLRLFCIVIEFISFRPEIGLSFYESFAWVDAFLKG